MYVEVLYHILNNCSNINSTCIRTCMERDSQTDREREKERQTERHIGLVTWPKYRYYGNTLLNAAKCLVAALQ